MYKIIGADGKEYGPVTSDQLRQWIAQGRADARTQAAAEGMTEWRPLGSFPEFTFLFSSAAATINAPNLVSVRSTSGFAVTGMILGILSLLTACCCYGLPFNVLGLVFSIIGLITIRGSPERYDGLGMAIAGLVLSALSILLAILFLVAGFASSWNQLMVSP
jgi:uncharacterized protein DUF4339/uncharacterized protein DUF4190